MQLMPCYFYLMVKSSRIRDGQCGKNMHWPFLVPEIENESDIWADSQKFCVSYFLQYAHCGHRVHPKNQFCHRIRIIFLF